MPETIKIIINETECDGFKVVSYIENLSEEERKRRDIKLSKDAIKVLGEFLHKQNNKVSEQT